MSRIKDICITVIVLSMAFFISLVFQHVFNVDEHITTLFVFAVFLISLVTDGYVYGIAAAVISMLVVNYAFTFPFFSFNFIIPVNIISAIVMIVIAFLTSMLTTQIKQHEAEKAESERERMRANLLRAVSHDLRTPLTTIYGSASTLIENGESLTRQQQEVILAGIKEDSEWLVHMVENLLSITRIDQGRVKITKTPTVLEELIDSIIIKFKNRYPAQEVVLDIPEEMVVIPMDAMLIEQVIINILENAVQHAEGMKHLYLRVYLQGDKAVFEIQDDGCGIEPDRLKNIFTGYYSVEDESSDIKKRNAGIGLSVCQTIVKAHDGVITARNHKNGGAVFSFMLQTDTDFL